MQHVALESTSPAAQIGAQCLAVRLRMLNRRVSRIYDEALRPHGVGVAQLNLLVAIANLEQAHPTELVASLGLEKSTLSRNVKGLAAREWVEIWVAADGRGQLLTLSQSGRELLAAALPAWEQAQARAQALLGEELTGALAGVSLRPH